MNNAPKSPLRLLKKGELRLNLAKNIPQGLNRLKPVPFSERSISRKGVFLSL